MLTVAQLAVSAATLLVALALAAHTVALLRGGRPDRAPGEAARVLVGAGVGAATATHGAVGSAAGEERAVGEADGRPAAPAGRGATSRALDWYGDRVTQLAFVFMTVGLLARMVAVGHGPFANQYEFATAFAWGMLAGTVWFTWRHAARVLSLALLPVILTMLLYAASVGSQVRGLVPALQHQVLLTVHVSAAVLAYGAASVAAAAGALYLARPRFPRLPDEERLDELGYRAAVIAFPLMTLMILLGAVWADLAWGTYWSWDPKETAALVTWLIYAAYLHARVVRGLRGRRAAMLLVAGFGAVLFTYFGNLFLGGLHAYA